jgi:hypothetical protein
MAYVALRDLAAVCGKEHVTKPRRPNTQGRIFTLLVMCYATLTVTESGIYAIEDFVGV